MNWVLVWVDRYVFESKMSERAEGLVVVPNGRGRGRWLMGGGAWMWWVVGRASEAREEERGG